MRYTHHMTPQLYLVGGAVRDTLLQRPVKDRDYVLVGGTEADIIAKWPSAKRVGKAFPVYLIGGVGEVALARRERKTGPRHQDFAVEFGPEVTLEEDLSRRDLTINAIQTTSTACSADIALGILTLKRFTTPSRCAVLLQHADQSLDMKQKDSPHAT